MPTGDDTRPTPRWLRPAPLMFLLLWSGGYTGVKVSLADIEPVWLLVVRYTAVLAILLPVMLVLRPPLPRTLAAWGHLAIVGVLVQGLYFGGINVAAGFGVSVVGLAIILALQPILVALLAPRLAGERIGAVAWVGLILGLAGVAVTVLSRGELEAGTLPGVAVAVLALLAITAGTLWEKRFGGTGHLVTANVVQVAAALAVALPYALAFETGAIRWTPRLGTALAYLVLLNSIIAMTLLLAMIRHGAASRVSALFFLVPPVSMLIAWLVLGEPMPPAAFAGMALAGLGVFLVGRSVRPGQAGSR